MPISTPQYNNYRSSSPKASLTGIGNKRSGTRPEKLLLRALRKLGITARPPKRRLQGNPDLVFWKNRLVVFCDGDFWHGKNWNQRRKKLEAGSNAGYWVKKIVYNRSRDRKNRQILKSQGWEIIRVWESSLLKDSEKVAREIMKSIKERKYKNGSQ